MKVIGSFYLLVLFLIPRQADALFWDQILSFLCSLPILNQFFDLFLNCNPPTEIDSPTTAPTIAPTSSTDAPTVIKEEIIIGDEGFPLNVEFLNDQGNGTVLLTGSATIPFGEYEFILIGLEANLDQSNLRNLKGGRRAITKFENIDGKFKNFATNHPVLGCLIPLVTPISKIGTKKTPLDIGYGKAKNVSWLDPVIEFGDETEKSFFRIRFDLKSLRTFWDKSFCLINQVKDKLSKDASENEADPSQPVYTPGCDSCNVGSFPPEEYLNDAGTEVVETKPKPPSLKFGSWMFRDISLEIAIDPIVPIVYCSVGNIFPKVTIPYALPGFTVYLKMKKVAIGYAGEDFLALEPTKVKSKYDLMPKPITGNVRLFASFALYVSPVYDSDLKPTFQFGVIFEGAFIVDLNVGWLVENEEDSQFISPAAFQKIGIKGDIKVYVKGLNLLYIKCLLGSSTYYYEVLPGGGTLTVATGAVTLFENCDFQPIIGKMFKDKIDSSLTFYVHTLTPNAVGFPESTPRDYLEITGDVGINWDSVGLDLDLISMNMTANSLEDLFTVYGEFTLPFPNGGIKYTLEGKLQEDTGFLKGQKSVTIPIGSFAVVSAILTVDFSYGMDDVLAALELDVLLGWKIDLSGDDEEYSFEGSFTVSGLFKIVEYDDGSKEAVLLLCGEYSASAIVDTYAKGGVGNANCIDTRVLFFGLENGDSCILGQQCKSGRCEGGVATDRVCEPKLPDNAIGCNELNDCESGRCDGSTLGQLEDGQCLAKEDIDGCCDEDSDCISDNCNYITSGPNDCPFLTNGFPSGSCRRILDNGETGCNENKDCKSGRCECNLTCGPTSNGTCREKLGSGEYCNEDSDCQSGECDCGFGGVLNCNPLVSNGACT